MVLDILMSSGEYKLLNIHYFNPKTPIQQPVGVILLHGLGGSVIIWRHLIKSLTRRGIRVFALDLLGFNGSPCVGKGVAMRDHIDYLVSTCYYCQAKYGLRQLSIIGHSFGGQIAIAANGDYPNYFRQVIAINSPLLPPEIMRERIKSSLLGRLYYRERMTRKIITYIQRSKTVMRITKRISRLVLDDHYHPHVEMFFRTHRFENYFYNTRNVILNNRSHICLNCPNLTLVYSQKDQYMREADIESLAEKNRLLKLVRIKHLGHNPMIDPKYQQQMSGDILNLLDRNGDRI